MTTRVTRGASKALTLLDSHPIVKLAALLWVAAVSVLAPVLGAVQYWRTSQAEEARERAEAIRGGYLFDPLISAQVGFREDMASGRRIEKEGQELPLRLTGCSVTNEDVRPVAEVSLALWVHDVAFGRGCESQSAGGTLKTAPLLAPRRRLDGTFPQDLRADLKPLLQNLCAPVHPDPSPDCGGRRCLRFIECQARYYRPADMKPFRVSGVYVVNSRCNVEPLLLSSDEYIGNDVQDDVRVSWFDEEQSAAFACLTGGGVNEIRLNFVEHLRAERQRDPLGWREGGYRLPISPSVKP